VRQGNQDTGPFGSQHIWILHVLREHPAHNTNSDACLDTDYLDASPTPAKSLDTKDSILCPHLLCPTVLHSESDLWHHLGDVHSPDKPHAVKKRQHSTEKGQDDGFEFFDGARRKRPRPLAKKDRTSKLPAGRKSAPKRRSVNVSAIDFDPSLRDVIEAAAAFSSSTLCPSTQGDSVWDEHDDCSSTDTSLSSVSSDLFEAVPETRENCHSPWSGPSETTTVEIPIDPEILHEVPPVPYFNDIEVPNLTGLHNTLEPNCPIRATTQSAYSKLRAISITSN
jgi:hypothetical protein